ncbi:MAG: hypothetical protein WBR14_21390 [Candidatus Acidiferrum sp.]
MHSFAGLLLATGYERVIFLTPAAARLHGGPYVELNRQQVQLENFHRATNTYWNDFHEWRSNCASNVMLYEQLRTVGYADYQIGFYYITASEIKETEEK